MITPAERQTMFDRLTETRDLVHRTAQGLSPEQLQYRPEPGRWSVAENLEHITVVEERILAGLMRTLEQPPDPVKKPALTDEQLFQDFGRVVQPLTAPDPFRPTSRWPLADLLDKFDAARRLTLDSPQPPPTKTYAATSCRTRPSANSIVTSGLSLRPAIPRAIAISATV